MYLIFTVTFSAHVLRIDNKRILYFEDLYGFNSIILLLVLRLCPAVYMRRLDNFVSILIFNVDSGGIFYVNVK